MYEPALMYNNIYTKNPTINLYAKKDERNRLSHVCPADYTRQLRKNENEVGEHLDFNDTKYRCKRIHLVGEEGNDTLIHIHM